MDKTNERINYNYSIIITYSFRRWYPDIMTHWLFLTFLKFMIWNNGLFFWTTPRYIRVRRESRLQFYGLWQAEQVWEQQVRFSSTLNTAAYKHIIIKAWNNDAAGIYARSFHSDRWNHVYHGINNTTNCIMNRRLQNDAFKWLYVIMHYIHI